MTKKASTYESLKKINVNEHTEQKGKFTYLSWTWAWNELMKVEPTATYEVLPVEYHNDDSATVHTRMTIGELTHQMYLPVLNYQNKAISNPNSFDINTARMRCLVKNIAMFGLGIYIYAGEDLPDVDPKEAYQALCKEHLSSINAIKQGIETGDFSTAVEAWHELTDEIKKALWVAPTKGGIFTTKERAAMKSNEWHAESKAMISEAA